MKFEEALNKMCEGKVTILKQGIEHYLFKLENSYGDLRYSEDSGKSWKRQELNTWFLHRAILSEAWEVVDDDSDWNLAEYYYPTSESPVYDQESVKKCRDLILKHSDYADCLGNEQVVPVSKIKEIFGDLK